VVLLGGNASGVERIAKALSERPPQISWLALRDRDLADAAEVQELESSLPGLRVWQYRTIENLFLDGRWISITLARSGMFMDAVTVESKLAELARNDQDELERLLVERRLERDIAVNVQNKKDLKAWYVAVANAARDRGAAYDPTISEIRSMVRRDWESRWKEWAQGKRVLAQFLSETPYRSLGHFIDAMTATCIEDPSLMPLGFTELREKLRVL
jgi:hypothetical protein